MISYKHLHRHPIDRAIHWVAFTAFSLYPSILPLGTEIRSLLTVLVFVILNICKFFFRAHEDSRQNIERHDILPFSLVSCSSIIAEHKLAYPESNRVAIITGSTSGIGKEIAKAVSKAGFFLILPVRNRSKAERVRKEILAYSGNDRIEIIDCDLESLASIRKFANTIISMNISVNLLINNAGIAVTKFGRTKDGFELNFGTNYVAHYYLTELLLKQSTDHLDPDSVFGTRILNITSASFYGVSKIEEQNFYSKAFYERFSPYARSKYAQVLYTMELSRKLLPLAPKTTINACEPGMTKTDIYRYDTNAQIFFKGLISTFFPFLLWKPEEGAISAIWAALSPDVHQVTGKVFGDLHEIPMGTSVLEESDTHLGYLSALSHRLVLEKLPEPF